MQYTTLAIQFLIVKKSKWFRKCLKSNNLRATSLDTRFLQNLVPGGFDHIEQVSPTPAYVQPASMTAMKDVKNR